jgi:hypothetical protein
MHAIGRLKSVTLLVAMVKATIILPCHTEPSQYAAADARYLMAMIY